MWKHKRNDELNGLREELQRRDEADRVAREQQRHQDETGWGADGRWSRPSRAGRDRLARGDT